MSTATYFVIDLPKFVRSNLVIRPNPEPTSRTENSAGSSPEFVGVNMLLAKYSIRRRSCNSNLLFDPKIILVNLSLFYPIILWIV